MWHLNGAGRGDEPNLHEVEARCRTIDASEMLMRWSMWMLHSTQHPQSTTATMAEAETKVPLPTSGLGYASSSAAPPSSASSSTKTRGPDDLEIRLEFG